MRQAELGHDLDEAYAELGREAFNLMQTGVLSERSLAPLAARVGQLEAKIGSLATPERGA